MSTMKNNLKWLSLIVLVVQNASTILLLRYVRTAKGDLFFSTTAIVCQEIIKVFVSVFLLFTESFNLRELTQTINQQILKNRMDSIKTGIPALLYTLQTNLVYLAISNLNAAVFQVTFQMKIFTTAIFMVILLKKSLRWLQWFSLFLLCVGISIIQVQNVSVSKSSTNNDDHKNAFFGLICVILACILSGLAGVYFEKILKKSKSVSIWVRNIQLGMFGTFFALLTVLLSDGDNIRTHGFFFGYNALVWLNILVQSAGGLIVAVVIKYADNILKGFATSIAIVISCLASAYLFGTIIDLVFALGTLLVVASVVLYSYTPPSTLKLPSAIQDDQQSQQQQQLQLLSNSSNSAQTSTPSTTRSGISTNEFIPTLLNSTPLRHLRSFSQGARPYFASSPFNSSISTLNSSLTKEHDANSAKNDTYHIRSPSNGPR